MPGDRAKATKPSMPKRILSIRARLMVLALLAMTPLMFERVRALEAARAERSREQQAERCGGADRQRLAQVMQERGRDDKRNADRRQVHAERDRCEIPRPVTAVQLESFDIHP